MAVDRRARRILDDLFGKDEEIPEPKPARVVRMEVIMRWTRMRWPDGMSFSPLQDGFGWVPEVEKRKTRKEPKGGGKGNEIIRLSEVRHRIRRSGVG